MSTKEDQCYVLTKESEFYLNQFKSYADKVLMILKHDRGMYPPATLLQATNLITTSRVAAPQSKAKLKATLQILNVFVTFIGRITGAITPEVTKIDGVNTNYETLRIVLKLNDFPKISESDLVFVNWQKYYWPFLHYTSIQLYFNRDTVLWNEFAFIFYLFDLLLPCGICAENFRKKPREELIRDKFSNDIIMGMFEFHNMVNQSKVPPSSAIEFSEFAKLYHVEVCSGSSE
jgi:hypothetical protein